MSIIEAIPNSIEDGFNENEAHKIDNHDMGNLITYVDKANNNIPSLVSRINADNDRNPLFEYLICYLANVDKLGKYYFNIDNKISMDDDLKVDPDKLKYKISTIATVLDKHLKSAIDDVNNRKGEAIQKEAWEALDCLYATSKASISSNDVDYLYHICLSSYKKLKELLIAMVGVNKYIKIIIDNYYNQEGTRDSSELVNILSQYFDYTKLELGNIYYTSIVISKYYKHMLTLFNQTNKNLESK